MKVQVNYSVLASLVFFFALLSCSEENLQIEQLKISKARNQAEVLSYEALVINAPAAMNIPTAKSRRGPASETDNTAIIAGTMGKDPWGQSYKYSRETFHAKSGEKNQTHVVVWSAGPNKQFEFSPQASPGQSPGDDIVVHQSQ